MTRVASVLVCSLALLCACSRNDSSRTRVADPAPVTQLERTDVVQGAGEGISQGQVAVVHYTGWLYEPAAPGQKGRKFDSSRDRGQPFRFTVGEGKVIRGWEEGVQGMQVGGQRRLVIPPNLGYGKRGAPGAIPPNATLLFEIELLGIEADSG